MISEEPFAGCLRINNVKDIVKFHCRIFLENNDKDGHNFESEGRGIPVWHQWLDGVWSHMINISHMVLQFTDAFCFSFYLACLFVFFQYVVIYETIAPENSFFLPFESFVECISVGTVFLCSFQLFKRLFEL